jgi:hypothetical protein
MYRAKTAASAAALLFLLSLTGCAADNANGASENPTPTNESAEVGLGADVDAMLAPFDIESPASAADLIEQLEAQPLAERPDGLIASVGVSELTLSDGVDELSVPLPAGQFHLSVAPYLTGTHECFYHSLTTCAGEMGGEQVHVTITDDASDEVYVDRDFTTFENGYFDVWLPADRDITLSIDDGEHTAEVPLGTHDDDPTCVTTVQLS